MILSVRRPQYFISHTKSQRLLVTRHRLSCEKVNLHNTLVLNVSLGRLWILGLLCAAHQCPLWEKKKIN